MEDKVLYFWLLGFLLFFPIVLFKNVFLKIAILCYSYPVWLLSGYAFGISVTRIMSNIGDTYYSNLYSYGFILAISSYIAFLIAIWGLRNKAHELPRLKMNFLGRVFLVILFLVSIAIAYPSVYGLSESRFGMAGSIVVLLMSFIILTTPRKGWDSISVLMLLLLLFIVLKGERVDFILGIIAVLVYANNSTIISIPKFTFIIFSALLLATVSGLLRAGSDIDFMLLLQSIPILITNFGTTVDVIHVYMSSIWYIENIGLNFYPILNLINSYLPLMPERGVGSDWNFVYILRNYIDNLGGGLFYIVGVMGFGVVGASLFGFFYGYAFKKLFFLKGIYSLFFIAFFIMQFRLQWYGLTYYGTVFLLIIVTVFIFMLVKDSNATRTPAISNF